MGTVLFGVLEQGLKFAALREGNKPLELLKQLHDLKKDYYEELKRKDYSQFALDSILLEIYTIADTFGNMPVPSK